jgi:hypothetical protein
LTSQLDKYLQAHPTGYHPFANITTASKADIAMTDFKPPTPGESGSDSDSEFEVEDEFPKTPPPGFADPASYTQNQIDRLVVLMKGGSQAGSKTRVVPLGVGLAAPSRKSVLNFRHFNLSVMRR